MGKTMSIVMKKKLTATALAIATIMGMGYNSLASAADANFTAQLTVVSPNRCEPELTPPATNSWNTTWTLARMGDNSGTIDTTAFASDEPLEIKVKLVTDVGTCDLNGMVVGADANGVDVSPVNGQTGYYQVDTKAGGFWRYLPTLAKATFFTDDSWADADNAGTVTAISNGATLTQDTTSAPYSGHENISGKPGFGAADALGVSKNYFVADAILPLTATKDVVVKTTTTTPMKSAIIGVSAVIAKDPVSAVGTVDTALVRNAAVITMPFTVQVGYR